MGEVTNTAGTGPKSQQSDGADKKHTFISAAISRTPAHTKPRDHLIPQLCLWAISCDTTPYAQTSAGCTDTQGGGGACVDAKLQLRQVFPQLSARFCTLMKQHVARTHSIVASWPGPSSLPRPSRAQLPNSTLRASRAW